MTNKYSSKSVLEIVRLILEGGSLNEVMDQMSGVSTYNKIMVVLLLIEKKHKPVWEYTFSYAELGDPTKEAVTKQAASYGIDSLKLS